MESLAHEVAASSDRADWTRDLRDSALLATIGHLIDLHGWKLDWDVRGVRMTHENHSIVLGVPGTFDQFRQR